jgi:hypothetical protein
MAVMMGCGHAANARTADGKACCAICFGLHPEAGVVVAQPDLSERRARCAYCRKVVPSATSLPFFEYRPEMEFDGYYDGCRGWD